MFFSRVLTGVAAVGLVAGFMGGTQVANASEQPNPNRTYIVDCTGGLAFKPREIVLACADAGVRFGNITWTRWNNNRAVGRGTLFVNTCEPTCADGNVIRYQRVRLTLGQSASGPAFGTMVNIFSQLTGDFRSSQGPALASTSTWKLDNPIAEPFVPEPVK